MRNKIKYQILIAALIAGSIPLSLKAEAKSCPDLKIVFASDVDGGEGTSRDYLGFKDSLEPYLQNSNLNYEFIDLDYPATGIDIYDLRNTLKPPIDVGDIDKLTDSVNAGIEKLINLVNYECPDSRYILAGFSEGAMVVSKSLASLNADKIIYTATFGDPLIYFPEGDSDNPEACNGNNLSNYRSYAPDCQTHQGLFGALSPYQPADFIDKLGTWCNQYDAFCSAHFNASLHTTYIEDGLYSSAAKTIFAKINQYYGIKNPNLLDINVERVTESTNLQFKKPNLQITDTKIISKSEAKIDYEIEGLSSGAIVIINHQIVGLTTEKTLYLENIQPDKEYNVRLVPIKKTLLGDGVDTKIQIPKPASVAPKAPNTGQR